MLQKTFFLDFGLFWPFFNQKTAKIEKIERKLKENLNRLMKFSEIWYVDASQQKKMLQKNCFLIPAFFGLFVCQKAAKIDLKNEENRQIYNITIEVVIFYLINLDYILKIQKRQKS